jgi:hypothetical protein
VSAVACDILTRCPTGTQASNGTDLSLIALGNAENGFSAREAEERLEAEGFTP